MQRIQFAYILFNLHKINKLLCIFRKKSALEHRQIYRLLQQPCWPIWHWPAIGQWALCALVVAVAAGAGAFWLRTAQLNWEKTEAQLRVVHLQLQQFREKASAQVEVSEMELLKPSFDSLGSLSAQWAADAEKSGLRVSMWHISPPVAAAKATQPLEHAPTKAGFSVQVQGSYSVIKSWLGQTLQAQPWMVVDKLQLHTSDVGSGMLEAQISGSIYVED